jgi:hypothetical protein
VLNLASTPDHWQKLIKSINQAIEIRIKDIDLQNLTRNMIAETLVRRFGYHNGEITGFLVNSLMNLGLNRESEIALNLYQDSSYLRNELTPSGENTKFVLIDPVLGKKSLISKFNDLVSLSVREAFFDIVFRSRLLSRVNRPFIRVWRLRGKSL